MVVVDQRTAHEDARCPVCKYLSVAEDGFAPVALRRCGGCGLVFRGRIESAEITDLYRENAYAAERMAAHTANRHWDTTRRLRWVTAHAHGRELLDVGAGTGSFVSAATAGGYNAVGVEPSELAASYGREHFGAQVLTGFLHTAGLGEATYDVVCAWHVLEHAPDPLELLEQMRERLRRGGQLFLEVPNIQSTGAELRCGRWAHLDPGAHVTHFSPHSLRAAFAACSLKILELRTLVEGYYDSPAQRVRPRRIAGRVARAARLRSLRLTHPSRGEMLQVVATHGIRPV